VQSREQASREVIVRERQARVDEGARRESGRIELPSLILTTSRLVLPPGGKENQVLKCWGNGNAGKTSVEP
jgi:hypothetical protein